MGFVARVAALPRLGVGLSTEHGAGRSGIRPVALRGSWEAAQPAGEPRFPAFLEIGADAARGFDSDAEAWIARGWPTTYHFLDLNLEEPEDLDQAWLDHTLALARRARAAWLCGDAGLWHVGPRDRGHGTLLPPILCARSATAMSEAVIALRERSGLEVLPENPPAQVMIGDLHPLAYFARVAEQADCGLLLDVSHLAIAQRALGLGPTSLLDAFPVERVVEVHVAGGSAFGSGRHTLFDDDHGPHVLDETWQILDAVVSRATALRAVVVECERNRPDEVTALVDAVRRVVVDAPGWRNPPVDPPAPAELRSRPPADDVDHRGLQRTLFRMSLDPAFAAEVRAGGGDVHPWLRAIDPDLLAADPGGRRRDQLLGNVALEFLHTARAAPQIVDGFIGAPEFHAAIRDDQPLPLAFASYAARALPPGPSRQVLALDAAMAEVRRCDARDPRGRPPAAVDLHPSARLVGLAAGTTTAAEALRDGRAAEPPGDGTEWVLIVGRGPPGPDRPLHIEGVPDGIAELIRALPLDDHGLAAFADRFALALPDVEALVAELVAEGILVRDPRPPAA